jgi:hypothetical protein
MAVKREFWKTEIKVTVISPDTRLDPDLNLAQIEAAITSGDCMGDTEVLTSKKISPKQVAKLAWKMGGNPTFFNLNEDGTEEVDPEF